MKRRTKNPKLAMERLAAHAGVGIAKKGKLYKLYGGPIRHHLSVDRPRNAKKCLARMVTVDQWSKRFGGWGMEPTEVRDVIRLTRIDSYGTVGHEEEAIRRVLS